MIIIIDAEKLFDKIEHPFLIKTLTKLELEGKVFILIKEISGRSIGNILWCFKNYVFPQPY